jgi:hypothetical protein
MKINLDTIDRESFMIHPHTIAGVECYLVQPIHIGAKWNKHNLIFRSSVWTKDGEPVSLSYKKFFNWEEQPDIDPIPTNLNGSSLMEKLDGSTLLLSWLLDFWIWRTRGTTNAREQANGQEIDLIEKKYSYALFRLQQRFAGKATLVFEWLSPTNRIVIDYGPDVDIVLTNIINHDDYSYTSQRELDKIAAEFGLRRPQRYNYNSIEEMKASVEAFAGKEGLCVYFDHDQHVRKVKGAEYLYLHRAKSEISSFEKVLDVYLGESKQRGGYLSYMDFFNFLTDTFDFEIATMAVPHISKICDSIKEVEKILSSMRSFVEPLKGKPRKDAALAIIQAWGNTNRSGMAFKLLDGKPLAEDDTKKLVFQILK